MAESDYLALAGMRRAETQHPHLDSSEGPRLTPWTGWILFAGSMLALLGTFQMMQGVLALLNANAYQVDSSGLAVELSYTTWGWVHVIIGGLAVATGIGITLGQTWARVVGVGIAFLSAIANLAFLGAYPFWSTIVIAFDVIVIYALCVHGRELRNAD